MAAPMKLPTWYRALAVVVGVMSIGLAMIVLILPVLAIWLLIFFLALALLVMGIDRLVAGITGHPFGPGFFMPPASGGPGGPAGSPPTGPSPPPSS